MTKNPFEAPSTTSNVPKALEATRFFTVMLWAVCVALVIGLMYNHTISPYTTQYIISWTVVTWMTSLLYRMALDRMIETGTAFKPSLMKERRQTGWILSIVHLPAAPVWVEISYTSEYIEYINRKVFKVLAESQAVSP